VGVELPWGKTMVRLAAVVEDTGIQPKIVRNQNRSKESVRERERYAESMRSEEPQTVVLGVTGESDTEFV
jgi:hypothetical protein